MKHLLKKIIPYYYLNRIKEFLDRKKQPQRTKFYSQFIKSGDLVFDVGANIGNRVRNFLALHAKVVAVEPQPQCVSYLRKRFGKKIILAPFGLGSKVEDKVMHICEEYDHFSSISNDFIDNGKKSNRFSKIHWTKEQPIKLITLDLMIKKHGVPKFIKIDVEGYEVEVIRGLSHKVPLISFEYCVPEMQKNISQVISHLLSIDSKLVCNYSIGESMKFAKDNWMTGKEMLEFILTNEFLSTSFGDIYVKMNA
jgi:FkbM family methyltransferase